MTTESEARDLIQNLLDTWGSVRPSGGLSAGDLPTAFHVNVLRRMADEGKVEWDMKRRAYTKVQS